MPRNIEQVNELLKRELGQIISGEIPLEDGFITISSVKCSPDLQYAKIFVSVLPDNKTPFALKNLRKKNSAFTRMLQKKIKLHHIPKFNWIIDESGKRADEMESLFEQIKEK